MRISIEDLMYPDLLRKIKKPPKQLYVKGNVELLRSLGIAVIGSRDCSEYGERMAKKFAKGLCLSGFTVISGMAIGIDSFAHFGSLSVGGATIAVLPSGLGCVYPEENIALYNKIIESNGLVLSEYEDSERACSERFLERNRIVSGLAVGTLVIEGGFRSGTSVTANLTKEQGKNLFCVPSTLESKKGITPNRLIREGAFLVTDVVDIVNKYPELNLNRCGFDNFDVNIFRDVKMDDFSVDEEYKCVFDVLDTESVININDIVKRLNLDINEVCYKLMMLELEDKVLALPGNNFKRK